LLTMESFSLMNFQSLRELFWRFFRQPLEDRVITISRAKFTIDYPASFHADSIYEPLSMRIS
jgi:hypothetical protein